MVGAGADPTTLAPGPGSAPAPVAGAVVAGPGGPIPQPTPSSTPPPTATKGPLDVGSLREYIQANPWVADPANADTYNPNLSPEALSRLQTQERAAEQALEVAKSKFPPDPADVVKALDNYNTVLNRNAALIEARRTEAQKAQQTAQQNWATSLETSYNKAHELQQQNTQQIGQMQQQADINTGTKTVDAMNTDANTSRNVLSILSQIGPQLENLPNGVLGTLVDKYPELVPMLQSAGAVDPHQATNIQLLQSARSMLSILQRPTGSGSLRVPEMDKMASYTPGTLNTPQARQEMLGRLLATHQRVVDEANFANNYFGRTDPTTGEPIYNTRGLDPAMNAPLTLDANGHPTLGSGLGPVVPEPPPLPTGSSDT